jgi:hypothetical protein
LEVTLNLEITTRNRFTCLQKNVLLHDVPDETTVGELKSYLKIYAGPDEEFLYFAKVDIIPTEACHGEN